MKSTHNQATVCSFVESKPDIRKLRGSIFGLVAMLSFAALFSITITTQAQSGHNGSSCHFISGFIHGQLIGPNADLCPIPGSPDGALTEIGTFTDSDDNVLGTFVACATSFHQRADGALMFGLAHTYTTTAGHT